MADCKFYQVKCNLAETGQEAAGNVLEVLAQDALSGLENMIRLMTTFWMAVPGPRVNGESGVTHFLTEFLDPYTALFAMCSLIIGAIKLMVDQSRNSSNDLLSGLGILILASGMGATLINIFGVAGDLFSDRILDHAIGDGDLGENLVVLMSLGGGGNPVFGLFTAALVASLGIPTAMLQFVFMLLRSLTLPILAGAIGLSAAFWALPDGRAWFRRFCTWTVAFLAYKPAAAIIYASGFVMVGENRILDSENLDEFGQAMSGTIAGLMLMGLSIIMLPALIGFVVPVAGKLTGSGGSGALAGAAIGGVAMGATHVGMSRAGSTPPPSTAGPSGTSITNTASTTNTASSTASGTANMASTAGTAGTAAAGAASGGTTVAVQAAQSLASGAKNTASDAGSATTGKDEK